ncbi:MAG: hypothetical protein KF688_06780 [Pirellulales bacterium]|nr:hypothetical protein [Pirellulales bacterium]MBX3432595.1 hypothetical protein [Pirellulales bacterium]
MEIDLPADLIERAKQMATPGQDAAAVFGEALDTLAWGRREVMAVREGIAAYEAGDYEALEDFDRDFRQNRSISPDV